MNTKQQLEQLISTSTHAVYDYEFQKALADIPWREWLSVSNYFKCADQYRQTFDNWIHNSELNMVTGLDRFTRLDIISGTTQTFDEAYYRYRHRHLRVFRGEYAYHKRIKKDATFLDDYPLSNNDYIIISAPFCSTGDIHPHFYHILEEATVLKVPVVVDCAYFGTCDGVDIDLNFPCIESVSFSLSKGLGLGDNRTGIRYSNYDDDLPICQQNDYGHLVLGAAKIGLYMMGKFSADHIAKKYKIYQEEVCKILDLTPTKCMHLALANHDKENKYLIDGKYHRVGIRDAVKFLSKNAKA